MNTKTDVVIVIKRQTRKKMAKARITKRESYDEIINRLLKQV
jgi:hypothetical protein